MLLTEIKEKLGKKLPDERFEHSVNVMESAVKLAAHYGENPDKAAIAGLLHDCARYLEPEEMLSQCKKLGIEADYVCKENPKLLHDVLGVYFAKTEYDVSDPEILDAIMSHTTGAENMTRLQKIIFLADFIEPGREFKGADELRVLAFEDLDMAVLKALDLTIKFVIKKEQLLHLDTVNARNWLLSKISFGESQARSKMMKRQL